MICRDVSSKKCLSGEGNQMRTLAGSASQQLRWLLAIFLSVFLNTTDSYPFQLDAIDHFAINVHDLQISKAWYQKVFGFSVLHEWNGVAM
jgi:4-hydroxyphenylpyruvate dioxygenase-like putative hemolysin